MFAVEKLAGLLFVSGMDECCVISDIESDMQACFTILSLSVWNVYRFVSFFLSPPECEVFYSAFAVISVP